MIYDYCNCSVGNIHKFAQDKYEKVVEFTFRCPGH